MATPIVAAFMVAVIAVSLMIWTALAAIVLLG